ncbi:MAG TPA: 4Fe-4S binding protein [Herpetosiphonaceae bacterium]
MIRRAHVYQLWRWAVPSIGLLVFASGALVVWRRGESFTSWMVWSAISAAIALSLWRYFAQLRSDRAPGRRLVLFVVGASLFGISVWTQRNVQIEGLFFGLLTGVVEGAVIHYLLAKLIGPLLFGRIWCGWACWIGALLDLLPYRRPSGRLMPWTRLRYAHFGLSLLLVSGLWFGTGYGLGVIGPTAVYWFLLGNTIYLVSGIVLAIVLKDNRAFCKYLCPITVPLKLTSRFALLKVTGDPSRCDQDRACERVCPMGIRITEYLLANQRVLSTECILCQECINVCDHDALRLSFGVDRGGLELLTQRSAAEEQPAGVQGP